MVPQIKALSGSGQKKAFGHIAAIVTMLLWGSTFAAAKIVIDAGVSPLEMLIVRFALAWLVLQLIPCAKLGFTGWRDEVFFMLAGLGGVTFYFLFENTALSFTYASNVGLICGINPLFTAALFWIIFKERPSKWFALGSTLAVFGVVCVATNGAELQMGITGDLLAVLACVSWSFYTVSIRRIRKMPRKMDDIAITRRVFFWGVVGSLILVPFSGTADFLRVGTPLATWATPEVILPLLYLAVFASCLCYVANTFAMRVIGEVSATAYIYTIPAISLLASSILLGEPISPLAIIGMVAITVGLIVSEEFWKRAQKKPIPNTTFDMMEEYERE